MRVASTERTTATGLDYFGARYFSAAQGRFTSVDPVSLVRPIPALISSPQRWNAYAYALNNPLAYIDTDGRFSEPVHSRITTQAAQERGYSKTAIAALNTANRYVDRKSNFLGNREHGIQDTYRTERQAYAATAQVITDRLNSAVQAAVSGDYAAALNSLGQGTHTVEDLQAHGMKYLLQHPLGEASIDNDKQKVANALIGTQNYLGIFEATVVRVMGEEKGQKALSELKSFVQKRRS